MMELEDSGLLYNNGLNQYVTDIDLEENKAITLKFKIYAHMNLI